MHRTLNSVFSRKIIKVKKIIECLKHTFSVLMLIIIIGLTFCIDFLHAVEANQNGLNQFDSVSKVSVLSAEPQVKNRFGMILVQKEGDCEIQKIAEINKVVDVNNLKDLYVPYKYTPILLKSTDYQKCKTLKVIYKEYPDYFLSMEVDLPLNSVTSTPFIIYVHGGGWTGGNSGNFKPYSTYLASNGIAGIRIEYSLKNHDGHFQQGLDEVEAAYKFVESKAKEWNLDMNRFGFAGGSAGTPLAAYWAMKIPICKLFVGFNGIYNLTDNRPQGGFPGKASPYLRYFKDNELRKSISALSFIPQKNPPAVFVAHGTGDITISYLQSTTLCDSIEKKGGKTKRLIYPYYQHGFYSKNSSDKYEEILTEVCVFAKDVFKLK